MQSMADLYRLYVTKCTEENQNPLCIRILKEEFEKKIWHYLNLKRTGVILVWLMKQEILAT